MKKVIFILLFCVAVVSIGFCEACDNRDTWEIVSGLSGFDKNSDSCSVSSIPNCFHVKLTLPVPDACASCGTSECFLMTFSYDSDTCYVWNGGGYSIPNGAQMDLYSWGLEESTPIYVSTIYDDEAHVSGQGGLNLFVRRYIGSMYYDCSIVQDTCYCSWSSEDFSTSDSFYTIGGGANNGPGGPGGPGRPGGPERPGSPERPGGGGCPSCLPAGDTLTSFSFQNTNIAVGQEQSETLNFYGSLAYGTEINADGHWVAPDRISGWQVSSPSYTKEDGVVTNVSFSVTDTTVYPQITREYSLEGSWEDESQCKEETKGRIPLQDVKYVYVENGASVTKLHAHYEYPSNSNTAEITNYNYNGDAVGYIVYEGGIDPSKPEESLGRIWYGTNKSNYCSKSSSEEPAGGRWVDIQTETQSQSGIAMIKEVSTCSSCGGAKRQYSFVPANQNVAFYSTGSTPTDHLVGQINDSSGQALTTYDYDSRDRLKCAWLGDKEIKAFEKIYTDRELVYTSSTGTEVEAKGNNSCTEKSYITNSQFRLRTVFGDDKDRPTREIVYHDLQSSAVPIGSYSETLYSYTKDEYGNRIKTITLPDKSKVYETYSPVYDSAPNIRARKLTKRVKNGVVEFERTYRVINEKIVLMSSKNETGGQTVYTYNSRGNVETRTEPIPGVFGISRQLKTTYEYNDLYNPDLVTKEKTSDWSREPIYYTYDEFGNLKTRTQGDMTSNYEYNEYNEQILSYDSAGSEIRNIHRKFYSNVGVVVAEATYLLKDDGEGQPAYDSAISAAYYEYDGNGRLENKKTAKMSGTFSFAGDLSNTSINWVDEEYQYDAYGRRTAVIADADGEHLTTTYEYNNQSEVIRVTTPDQHCTETVRDGRGLVSEVITGVKSGGYYEPKATTSYSYDPNGNLVKKKDPTGVCENYKYDKRGRKVRTWKTKE